MKNKNIHIILLYGIILVLVGVVISNRNLIFDNNKIILKNMDESTQIADKEKAIDELNTSYSEYYNSIQKGKQEIANAIKDKGIETSELDSLETMATNIKSIPFNISSNAKIKSLNANYSASTASLGLTIYFDVREFSEVTITTSRTGGSASYPGYSRLYPNGSGDYVTINNSGTQTFDITDSEEIRLQFGVGAGGSNFGNGKLAIDSIEFK